MTIKNYTSSIPASRSMARIEELLVEAGATDISKSYSDGICSAIRFRMEINGMPVFFQLPANVDACFNVLWAGVKRPQPDTKKRLKDQASMTAWKIVSDWVEIQLAMIKLEQAKTLQIFLPYVWNPDKNETLYHRIEANQKLLSW
jgi:hypothetical protein